MFAIGTTSGIGLRRRAIDRERRNRNKARVAASKRWQPALIPAKIDFRPGWCIIPGLHPGAELFLYHAGRTCPSVLVAIRRKKAALGRYGISDSFQTALTVTIPLLDHCTRLAIKNQRILNAFRCLARRWLFQHMKQGNAEDLLTGDVPTNPIVLVDWANRTKYFFEPRTIMKDMVERLLTSTCLLFPNPKCPRNPYTNLSLTPAQFDSVIKQLRRQGHAHWALEALNSVGYNMTQFNISMYTKLRSSLLRRGFADPKNVEANEILLEYIESEYEANQVSHPSFMFKMAMKYTPDHPHICKWRALYCRDTMLRINYGDHPPKKDADRVIWDSRNLCERGGGVGMYDTIMSAIKKGAEPSHQEPVSDSDDDNVSVHLDTILDMTIPSIRYTYTFTYNTGSLVTAEGYYSASESEEEEEENDNQHIDTTLFSPSDDEGASPDSL